MNASSSKPKAAGKAPVHAPRILRALSALSALALFAAACGGSTRETSSSEGGGGEGGEDPTPSGAGNHGSTGAPAGVGGAGGVGGVGGSGGGGSGVGGALDPCGDPITDLTEIDLGDINLNEPESFTICNNTVGFTALVTAPDPGEIIGVSRLKPPTGGSVILNFAMAGHTAMVFGRYGWIGAADPQSDSADAFPVKEGDWQITIGDDDASVATTHTSVWTRRTSDGLFHGGLVDVNIFIAPNTVTKGYVNSVLGDMFPYADLKLGDVTFYTLDASYTNVGTQAEFSKLLQSSKGAPTAPALNLFVIGDFGAEFGDAIGIAGGIPGSPMEHGTGMSGVVYEPSGDPTYDASVLRHETGHLSGLFHTTEFAIEETDPLSDTPTCPTQTMKSNPDNCPDVTNAMFPIAYGATKFTAAQDIVLHGSMLYRGILKEGGAPVPPKPVPPVPGAPELLPLEPETPARIAALPPRSDKPLRPGAGKLERVLGGLWCSHGGGDYMALALRVAGPTAGEQLRALALDKGAPSVVRRRALMGYARASQGSPRALARALDLASSVARDRSASTDLRIAALRSLATHDEPRALALEPALTDKNEPNSLVRDVALAMNKTKKAPMK